MEEKVIANFKNLNISMCIKIIEKNPQYWGKYLESEMFKEINIIQDIGLALYIFIHIKIQSHLIVLNRWLN